jgi:hypothetical protein
VDGVFGRSVVVPGPAGPEACFMASTTTVTTAIQRGDIPPPGR